MHKSESGIKLLLCMNLVFITSPNETPPNNPSAHVQVVFGIPEFGDFERPTEKYILFFEIKFSQNKH